jgi:hypothetical protein
MSDDLEAWRRTMGEAIVGWTRGPGASAVIGDGFWTIHTALPGANANLALVWRPGHVEQALAPLGDTPAILMLTGDAVPDDARPADVPAGWEPVGLMPFMRRDLADLHGADPRVRRATPADVPAVLGLCRDAFGIDEEVARILESPILAPWAQMAVWLLEQDGEPVSSVLVSRVDHVLTIWCMARGSGGGATAGPCSGRSLPMPRPTEPPRRCSPRLRQGSRSTPRRAGRSWRSGSSTTAVPRHGSGTDSARTGRLRG